MVPFWIPSIIRHLVLRAPKKGTIILTAIQMVSVGLPLKDQNSGFVGLGYGV